MPRNPAASCVSKSLAGVVPHARSRTSRSWSAAWMTASPGPASTGGEGRDVDGERVDEGDPAGQATWRRASRAK